MLYVQALRFKGGDKSIGNEQVAIHQLRNGVINPFLGIEQSSTLEIINH